MAEELLRWWCFLVACTLVLIFLFGALYMLARARRRERRQKEAGGDE